MHDLMFFQEKWKIALEEVKGYIKGHSCKEPEELSDCKIKEYSVRKAVGGWSLFPDCMRNTKYHLDIFFDNKFPYSLPKTAISPAPNFLQYPHIEKDGYLCLEEISHDKSDIKGSIDKVIESSLHLIYDCLGYKNQDDFKDEITTYWERKAQSESTSLSCYNSLINVNNRNTRKIKVCKENKLIAENENQIWFWLKNSGKNRPNIIDAFILWPHQILAPPSHYPDNVGNFYDYIKQNSNNDEVVKEIELKIKGFEIPIIVVLGFKTKDGVVFIGMEVFLIKKQVKKLKRIFSRGMVPLCIAIKRGYKEGALKKLNITRVDSSWALSRDANSEVIEVMMNKTVTIIGCGAIGSVVARLLVQSGVGGLFLIDDDFLKWENIGRHALGADSISHEKTKKVISLKEALCRDFPHISVESISKKWEELEAGEQDKIKEVDLIIMATGSWGAESAMNDYMTNEECFPPIVYGWAEAFACAGHSLAVFKDYGCLECFFNKDNFSFEMTEEFDKTDFQAPGCVATFNPFGSIELMPICSMIAEMCVDVLLERVTKTHLVSWLGAKKCPDKNKGKWSARAEELFIKSNNDYGNFRSTLELSDKNYCDSCSNKGIKNEVY